MTELDDIRDQLRSCGENWKAAREAERIEALFTYSWITVAYARGMPETHIAELVGCDRMTVRKALGKR